MRAKLRDDLPEDELPEDELAVHLINRIVGDQLSRVLRGKQEGTPEECDEALRQRMALF